MRTMEASSTRKNRNALLTHLLTNRIGKPSLKAFLYAYLYLVLPKVIKAIVSAVKKGKYDRMIPRMKKTMVKALHPRKFPMFAASLITGINVLEPLVYGLLRKTRFLKRPSSALFVSTLVSALASALVTFPLFQSHVVGFGRYNSLDLTLLVATRALDTVFSSTLSNITPDGISKYGDALLFIISSTLVMFSWFYHPEKLPPAYSKWITSAANMDPDFIEVLRLVRNKDLIYGQHGPYEDYLTPYFERYGRDPKGGNTVINQPIDCEAVHAFQCKSCELHALWRFWRGFKFAMTVYGPLNLFMLVFPLQVKTSTRLLRALKSSFRSSCFLGAFIGLYWYGVCLARTRLLPKMFPKISRTRFDDTICAASGAIMCGFSSFVETAQRRKELALFVAPRGLGALVPSEPSKINLKIESFVFSISLAILVAFSRNRSSSVRGIFGKGLKQIFNVHEYN